jgi:cyclopropane fatty-acyl-phospholipid synthase-like methyltransferase
MGQRPSEHVEQTIATYDLIATAYKITATPELRAWLEEAMRVFVDYLPGTRVLVPGCGDGRDSRYLSSLGLDVTSFDLSPGMLKVAISQDPGGLYVRRDLRDVHTFDGSYDGIWACGCLYHLTKHEFSQCIRNCQALLSSGGVLYLNMKEGEGQRYEEQPGPRCPGGPSARELLRGRRFYAYYGHEELLAHLLGFEVLLERRLLPAEGGFELWLRKRAGQHPHRTDGASRHR